MASACHQSNADSGISQLPTQLSGKHLCTVRAKNIIVLKHLAGKHHR